MNKKILFLSLALILILGGIGGVWAYQHSIFYPEPDAKIKLEVWQSPEIDYQASTVTEVVRNIYFTEEGANYLRIMLLEPSERINNMWWDKDEMSRCGSGANYNLTSKPTAENPYYYGEIWINKGCTIDNKFFDFRINPKNNLIEILDIKTQKYVLSKDWFRSAQSLSSEEFEN